MDYLQKTEAELRIDLDKPLREHDPLDRSNDLARKKRKHADDIHDHFRLEDFQNEVLYNAQEIFFGIHQDTRLDDHPRTFSSLLLVEVDKKNLNPLKQMRAIEQLRQ
nr:hypothetical protein [Tanacetum cinerariifolium]